MKVSHVSCLKQCAVCTAHFRKATSDRFGLLARHIPQVERLENHARTSKGRIIEDAVSFLGVKSQSSVPDINIPVGKVGIRNATKAARLVKFANMVKEAKVIIECSRPEFNHYAGMKYIRGKDTIPLVSEHWVKNKYKDHWFRINRLEKHSELRNWEQVMHLIHPDLLPILMDKFRAPTAVQFDLLNNAETCDHFFLAGETGSGKTYAYAALILSHIAEAKANGKEEIGVILVPSLVLRDQTVEKLNELNQKLKLNIVGGVRGMILQKNDVDILVATPGRAAQIMKGLNQRDLVSMVVLDEADNLLDESFVSELADFLAVVPVKNSTTNPDPENGARVIFSSATCPSDLQDLAEGIVDGPSIRYLLSRNLHRIPHNVTQTFIRIREMDKIKTLVDLLQKDMDSARFKTLVFCKDVQTAQWVSTQLTENGFDNFLLSSKVGEPRKSMDDMRVIVSTDMGSRGLDIPELSHVVNYNFPRHLVDYLHRIGRVGRCGASRASQRATSFVREPHEVNHVNKIEVCDMEEVVDCFQLTVRLNRVLTGIETNVAGQLLE